MDLPLSRIISTTLAILFLIAVAFKTFYPGDDPYRCRALQNTGRWIDPPDEEGNRYPFRQWQPDGCILHGYDSSDIRQCTEGRRIVIVGDSTSRGVAYAISRLINRKQLYHDERQDAFPMLRDNFNITYDGQLIQRLSNVYLASHGDPNQEQGGFVQNLDIYADEKRNPPSVENKEGPALIYVAGGLWFTHPNGNVTGLAPWDKRFGVYKDRINQLSKFIADNTPNDDPFIAPIDPYDGIGNQIFYAPPAGPCYQGDELERIQDNARRVAEVIDMQNWLHGTEVERRIPIIWSTVGVTTNQNMSWIDPLTKAAHVIEQVAETRANIILNLRCNAKLDRIKPYPYARTCCTDYGGNRYSTIVVISIIYLAACVVCEILDLSAGREPRWSLLNMQPGSILLALLMCYFADRTQMMAKGNKLWQMEGFALLCGTCIAVLLITIRRSPSQLSTDLLSRTEEASQSLLPTEQPSIIEVKDEPFLSREQTEEWKGWMQCFVLIYNWTGAERGPVPIYILFRLCVAAYLFQTGYGHTLYFIKKNDFSFNRVAATLLRLNTLSCVFTYFMNTNYMFYYSASLASFWFLIIYATMALGKQYNSDSQVVLAKMCISCILVSTVFTTPFTRWTFSLLKIIFNIQWNDDLWNYHVMLDIYAVYIGMVTAIVYHEMGSTLVNMGLRLILALTSLIAVFHYFSGTSNLKNSPYDTRHPYISFIPVLAFIALRNLSNYARNYHSRAMVWLGRCSLETSILQSHILLAADREGVLIVDTLFGDGTVLGDRWRTLLIIAPVFIWICYTVRSATGHIIELVLYETLEAEKHDEPAFAWLKIPGSSHLSAPKVRVACILLVMWFINMLSAGHEDVLPPLAGDNLISIMPMPPHSMDHPY